MIIEGLMGYLDEDEIGDMRGNIRAPEPRGFNQELIVPYGNPFPGSAKGGDGKRIGEQLRQLRKYFAGEVYYDSLIGNTLRGDRSMLGVLSSEPEVIGPAAFRELTRSSIGPELLLLGSIVSNLGQLDSRTYQPPKSGSRSSRT